MTFPQSDRVVFDKRPLEEVICQLRFPTILEINTEKPAKFQNRIRTDYPIYRIEKPEFPKELEDLVSGLHISNPIDLITYKFMAADEKKIISLSPEFVAFSDAYYIRWEKFYNEVKRAQEALEEIYKPAFYTRIGLRYRNIIDKEKLGIVNEPWDGLLMPSLLGLLGAQDNVGRHIDQIMTNATIKVDEVSNARATIQHGIGKRIPNGNEVYIIDIDVYTTERSNSQDVPDILRRFNQFVGNFFRWAITDKLRGILEPRKLQPED